MIVDDHVLFRNAVAALCSKLPDCTVAGQTGSGCEAVSLCSDLRPDLVLLDLELEDMDGFEVLAALRSLSLSPKVLLISSYSDDFTLQRVERARVDGYFRKDDPSCDAKLLAALTTIHSRARVRSEALDSWHRRQVGNPLAFHKLISPRQETILRLIAVGMDDAEVAEALSISRITARNHRLRIMRKLGIVSAAKLAVHAIRRGFGGTRLFRSSQQESVSVKR